MKKGILASIICFTSLVFSSCGSKYVKVTILECDHCSFENVTKARVGQDLVIQATLDRGYELNHDSDSLEIHAGGMRFDYPTYTFDKTTNKLTIKKDVVKFGDITIKGIGDLTESTFNFIVPQTGYSADTKSKYEQVNIEKGDYNIHVKPAASGTLKTDITVEPSNVKFEYDTSISDDYILKIKSEELYQNITVRLPDIP